MRVFLLDSSYGGETLYSLKKREIQYLSKVLRLAKPSSNRTPIFWSNGETISLELATQSSSKSEMSALKYLLIFLRRLSSMLLRMLMLCKEITEPHLHLR